MFKRNKQKTKQKKIDVLQTITRHVRKKSSCEIDVLVTQRVCINVHHKQQYKKKKRATTLKENTLTHYTYSNNDNNNNENNNNCF